MHDQLSAFDCLIMRGLFGEFNVRIIDNQLRLQIWLIAGTNNSSLADALNRSGRRLNLLLTVLVQFLQDFI